MAAFADRVFVPIHNAPPVRNYTGCGTNRAAGFVNIDTAPMWDDRDTATFTLIC